MGPRFIQIIYKPVQGSLLNNQNSMESKAGIFDRGSNVDQITLW